MERRPPLTLIGADTNNIRRVPEAVRFADIPVFTPDGLKQRMKEDEIFRRNVAGWTSFSLSQLLNGISKDGYSVPLNAGNEVCCDLAPSVYKELFPLDEMIPRTLHGNRDLAFSWVADEVQEELTGRVLDPLVPMALLHSLTALYRTQMGKIMLESSTSIAWMETHLPPRARRGIYPMDMEQLVEEFGTPSNFLNYLSHLAPRGGVQVLYGGKNQFTDFLAENHAREVDSTGAAVAKRVPGRLVHGIVALGKFEQGILLPAA